jgi:GntR family transcriptional regulator/MocR family aminotransferase
MQTNSDAYKTVPGFPTGLLITIDRSNGSRVRSQLERELRAAVQQGRLQPGAKLPPSRALATELGIARSVVVGAYSQLVAEGYFEATQGAGTRVCRMAAPPVLKRPQRVSRLNMAFTTGLPDPALFPRKEWLRCYRAAIDGCADKTLGYPVPQGRIELRKVLSEYLARVRSVQAGADGIVVCDGISQAIAIVCRAIRQRGASTIAVEDPCFAAHRRLVSACGLSPVPIGVDEDGIRVSELGEADVSAVLVAPAHSYPSGAVLSPERRRALADWARQNDALIVEDDYDAEFRFDRHPLGALQGLAPDNVVHAGSVSKVLNPSLRLGWMAAPERLMQDLIGTKFVEDVATETFGQLALARFIDTGAFARHIRRVRPLYRARRDQLLAELQSQAPELRPKGADAGLHLYVHLPEDVREEDVIAAAREDRLRVEGAAQHWAEPEQAGPAVLVGYGMLGESTIQRDVAALVAAVREATTRPARSNGQR